MLYRLGKTLVVLAVLFVASPADSLSSLEDGIRHYMQGARALSHSAYRDALPGEWEKAFQIFMEHQFIDRRTVITGNYLGIHYKNAGHYERALQYYKQTLPIARNLPLGVEKPLMNIGHVYLYQGRYIEAFDQYKEALDIVRKASDKNEEPQVILSIALLHSKIREFTEARKLNDEALALFAAWNDKKGIATLYNNTGVVYYDSDQYEKSLENYEKSKRLFQELGEPVTHQDRLIGVAYLEWGKIDKAAALLEKNGDDLDKGLLYLANKNPSKALDHFLASLTKWGNSGDAEFLFATYMGLGRCYEGLGDRQRAIQYFRKAAEVVQGISDKLPTERRSGFLKGKFGGFRRDVAFAALRNLSK